jgi:myo-inositol-1(or 4)-monophosphatase
MNISELATVTEKSAQAGAAVAEDAFRTELTVERKDGKTDVVTATDRDAQQAVSDRIYEDYPDATVVGEEGDAAKTVPMEGLVWVVDPIDGTNNFVRGNQRWATSVTCLVDGETVAAVTILPAMGDSYVATAEGVFRNGREVSVSDRSDPDVFQVVPTIWWDFDRRDEFARATTGIVQRFGDVRRLGCAQAVLAMLAAGIYEGTITNVDANPWDTIAGVAMVRWAGGTVTDLEGNEWTPESTGLVASNGQNHQEVLDAARDIDK